MGLGQDLTNAAGALANAATNPNAQNGANAMQAAIDAAKSAATVGGNIANNLSQNGGAITPPDPAALAALGSTFVQAAQTAVNGGMNPIDAMRAGIQVGTALTTGNFTNIDSALKNLDVTVPGSLATLTQSTQAINFMANDPGAKSIVAAVGGQSLADNIGSLAGNLNDLSTQYNNYNNSTNYFGQMAAKFAVGHNSRQAQGDIANILVDLKNLGL